MNEETPALNREDIRQRILGAAKDVKVEKLTLFGIDVELRQPSFAAIMEARELDNPGTRAASMIIAYACVPGTSERIFSPEDAEMIMEWPYGEDLTKVNSAIMALTGLNLEEEEEVLEKDPLA